MTDTWKRAKKELQGRGEAIQIVTFQKERQIKEKWAQQQSTQDILDMIVDFAGDARGWKPVDREVLAKELRSRFVEVLDAEQRFQNDLSEYKQDAERKALRSFRGRILARLKLA